ncbi:S8 family serine peptidase [Aliiglaciecola litoralis]|uniref:Peptidase S8/S53 domain-containing protein n=1 Tax=Aliiglaciecola litoralis TaxID=582857 RepID=A0ABP3X003_9ALTE
MKSPFATLSVIAASMLSVNAAHADALIGPKLSEQLQSQVGPFNVIVSFDNQQSIDSVLQNLNVPYRALQTLPMAGVTLSKLQLQTLQANPSVTSVYANVPLEYKNYTSGEITGGHYVQDNYNVDGSGVTIAVLDSGVDATHPDLELGTKTVENVKIVGDLDLAGGRNAFIEGVPNSDTTSGHGTHVAGTVGGTGAASANDERRANYHDGIAPGARLVGLGAGEGVSILYALLGFDYAIANQERLDIDIITNSWGGGDGAMFDPNNPINQASFKAYQNGMVVTFAASNSGPAEDTLNQYAIAPWVINVAAGTSDKQLADFSSRGVAGDEYKLPDITAPGKDITSTRAPNTAIGALGPVVDPAHPEYFAYYHTISGTSMATPFVAGVAALLLEVNPNLSPDQIEEIIKVTADPMDYAPHEVGTGYINVKAAVDMAGQVVGQRNDFLAGNTLWASQGKWSTVDDSDPRLSYDGKWYQKDDEKAYQGGYMKAKYAGSAVAAAVRGDRVRLHFYVKNAKPTSIELFSDGQSMGAATIYHADASKNDPKNVTVSFDGLGNGVHDLEIRMLSKYVYFDAMDVDGEVIESDVTYTEVTETYTGTMGVSAENLEVQDFPFEVAANDISIMASLEWATVADLDFALVNPEGVEVATSASLANPESLQFWVDQAGTYILRVKGYISVATPFTITNTVTKASKASN